MSAVFGIFCRKLGAEKSTAPGIEPGTTQIRIECLIHLAKRPMTIVSEVNPGPEPLAAGGSAPAARVVVRPALWQSRCPSRKQGSLANLGPVSGPPDLVASR